MSKNILKADRAVLQITENFGLDCYQLASGEYRVGYEGASRSLGHSKEWIGRLARDTPKLLKALQKAGYEGWGQEVSVDRRQGGLSVAKTISESDFLTLIEQESDRTNSKHSAVLLRAFARRGFRVTLEELFTIGSSTESVENIRAQQCRFEMSDADYIDSEKYDLDNLILGLQGAKLERDWLI